MFLAFISIGSNINSSENIGKAKILLDLAFDDCIYSSVYESKAIGFKGPLFKNLVASFRTSLEPGALTVFLKIMEKNIIRKNEEDYLEATDLPVTEKDDELSIWLAKNSKLMQRPIVVNNSNGKAIIGRPPENLFEIL